MFWTLVCLGGTAIACLSGAGFCIWRKNVWKRVRDRVRSLEWRSDPNLKEEVSAILRSPRHAMFFRPPFRPGLYGMRPEAPAEIFRAGCERCEDRFDMTAWVMASLFVLCCLAATVFSIVQKLGIEQTKPVVWPLIIFVCCMYGFVTLCVSVAISVGFCMAVQHVTEQK